jgi:TatD DNase family protein
LRLIDTHAHLSDLQDRVGVIERAREAGLETIVAVGANLETCRSTLEWAKEFRGYVHPALGIHPTEWLEEDIHENMTFIEDHIGDCIAVGEIGLDYWNKNARKDKALRERQRQLYTQQLEIADNHEIPASVHGRGAWEDALRLAREHGPERVIFHWYSGPLDTLHDLLDSGYLISATPAAEFSRHHRTALAETPLERIVIETDSPVSYHGKKAEPADLLLTLRSLAEIKDLPEGETARVTTENAKEFFNI